METNISFSYGDQSYSVENSVSTSNEDQKWNRLREHGAQFGALFDGTSHAGKSVSQQTALQLASFWACVRVNAQAMAGLPLQTFEKKRDGSRELVSDHEIGSLLSQSPNQDQTPFEFWETAIAWMLTQGNAFAEKRYIGNRLVALESISDKGVSPKRNSDGELEFQFNDRGKTETLPRNRVFHCKGFGFGGDIGLSVIRYGVQTLGASLATEEASGKIFGNGMQASGILTSDMTLKKEQREQLTQIMRAYSGSKNAGKMMILESGLKFNQITMNPEDAQMLETRRFNTEEICRWFGTPPIVIGHSANGQTMWGSGIEQILLAWQVLGINPVLNRLEQCVLKQLYRGTGNRNIYSEFNREALLQMDSNAKQRYLSSMVQNGLFTRNEARQKLNMPRVEGADDLTVQTALAPLDQLASAISGQNSNS